MALTIDMGVWAMGREVGDLLTCSTCGFIFNKELTKELLNINCDKRHIEFLKLNNVPYASNADATLDYSMTIIFLSEAFGVTF
ncbi:hypothetical protein OUZ56_028258 [Daphnia magna]|uniref:Uncharacterized protein n=1 Tax=Daphnia magna TaxID=35525 RepID=A0ABR0B3C0_9CRUS|nr:hypothetical protein OUZ56_028258 [Daphnia magna]